jgi:FAD/FMN-containing dehydrogenase/kynurenine formamidase
VSELGPIEDELAKARAAYRNWGRWGEDDVLGTLNYLDAAARVHAASLVRRGTAISLALEFGFDGPQRGYRGRINPVHYMLDTGTDAAAGTQGFPHGFGGADDHLVMPLQAGTQWDGLGHIYDNKQAWNGRPCTIVDGMGDHVTGIEHMADTFVGRGVLLDVARWCGDENRELADGFAIREEHLRATAEAQGATAGVRRGDIVLVRTGQLARVRRVGEWGTYAAGDAPGLSFTTLDWLYRTQIAAIATDTWGFEVRPAEFAEPANSPLHQIAIPNIGMPLGEMWDLEALAADCAADGVYEFLLVAAPLPVTGALYLLGDAGFTGAVYDRIFNGRRPGDRLPAAVLCAATEADVVAGVRLAVERGWRVAVRSGGHSWAAWSVRSGTLLIDLGGLREMSYDPRTGIATATPAIAGGDELTPYLSRFGRFFGGGHCPSVGLGGFLLQGGQGWNARGWGWAAEQIVALDVVTADGELVRADAERNTDLYWAARGSGPGFCGIVTRFHLRTRPLPRHLAHTVHVYPLALFDEVMTWLHTVHHTVPDPVEIVALTRTLPEYSEPVLLVTGLALTDTAEQAASALAPLHANPYATQALSRKEAAPTTFAEQMRDQRAANPRGHRYFVDNCWLSGPPERVVPAMRPAFTTLPTPASFAIWFSMAPLRPLPTDMVFSLQSEIYCAAYVVSDDASRNTELRAWLDGAMAAMRSVPSMVMPAPVPGGRAG